MNILFLDDELWRHEAVSKWEEQQEDAITLSFESEDAINLLCEEYFDIVFLDHDLVGGRHLLEPIAQSGMDVVDFLVEESERPESDVWMPGLVVVHSWNSHAAFVMVEKLKKAGIQAVRWFFDPTQNAVNLFREKANEARAKRVRLVGSHVDGQED